jgi:hypothetical protein
VSGNRRADFVGAEMVRLVNAIPLVQSILADRFVIIGGLAVLAQLSTPLRSTSDLDTATARRPGVAGSLELLLGHEGAEPADTAGVMLPTDLGAVKVDVLEVAVKHVGPPPEDPNDALYELAHTWAFETAEPMVLTASAMPGSSEPSAVAEAPVAGPGPLIATKLQSAVNRGTDKEATDLLDIIALLNDAATGPQALTSLENADPGLVEAAAEHVDLWFFKRREHTLRRVRSLPEGDWITPDLVGDVGEVLRAALPM